MMSTSKNWLSCIYVTKAWGQDHTVINLQLSRKFEAYGEIAERLHESVFIADEEMYSAVTLLCVRYFSVKHPGQLSAKDRIEMARMMKKEYNASNRQIRSILKLDKDLVEQLFPSGFMRNPPKEQKRRFLFFWRDFFRSKAQNRPILCFWIASLRL